MPAPAGPTGPVGPVGPCLLYTSSQLPGGAAYLSEVRQGTAFSVDEEGAEAAAYTELVMRAGSAAPPEGEPVVMELNRPFLYGVWNSEGTVLFLGRCDAPETA